MQDYNTIIGVIQMRQNECVYDVIQQRYRIGSSTLQLIMSRFKETGLTLEELKKLPPSEVSRLIYPPKRTTDLNVPVPDYQSYYDRITAKGSKVNLSYCWIEYKTTHPDGYGQSQFYENYRRFVFANHGNPDAKMAMERIPGEKVYIDWVGDQPELLLDVETGELKKVHVFVTTVGVSSLIYAEIFEDEKLQSFMDGTVHALQFYGALPKYLVPDNLKTAVTKHSRDDLILQSAFSDLEDFYDVIVLPPPPRKPKGKASVEGAVRFLETHLIEKLKEQVFTSIEALNAQTKKIVAALNGRMLQGKDHSRMDAFLKYDKPHMRPLADGSFAVCDYKAVSKVPDNYHIEYDGHYYSVLYSYCGRPAILKAASSEIRICDGNNRLICTHKRSYKDFPRYVTDDSHMRPEHLYYKEVNEKDGAYYRRWASVYGPGMSEFIDRLLKHPKHEEQAYNSCAGILHAVKDLPGGVAEEAAKECIRMNACRYGTFKQVLKRLATTSVPIGSTDSLLPQHENIRGKDYYN